MSDAQRFYGQHDDLEDREEALRADFMADVERFGGWEADENEIEQRLNGFEARHKRLHNIVNDLEQIEIDRSDGEKKQSDDDRSKELSAVIQRELDDIRGDLNRLEKDIDAWRDNYQANAPDA